MMKYFFGLILILQSFSGFGQSFERYVHSTCLQVAAFCAHPGLKYNSDNSSAKIFHNGIVLDIHYDEGVNTILVIYMEDGILTETKLHYDNCAFPAFATASMIEKALGVQTDEVTDVLQKQIRRYYQNLYNKSTEYFNGAELTTAILSYYWAVYVTTKDNTSISNTIGTVENPEVRKEVDGILIEGSSIFVERVIESLSIIKKYDRSFYLTYLANSNTKYNVVRGISMNTNYANTINEGHFLALHKSHEYRSDKRHNPYYLASVIVHETAHLYQYSAYAQLFDCKVSNYLFSYEHDPVAIAKKEINAHSIQLGFLLKLSENNINVGSIMDRSKKFIKDYKIAEEAGYLMFESKGPDCGIECKQKACRKMRPLFDEYGSKALMDRLYELTCIN